MKRIIFIILFAVFICLTGNVFAGEYKLVVGDRIDVCEAYEKNLNSFKELSHAMVCERLVDTNLKEFDKPRWRKLNIWENLDKIKNFEEFMGFTLWKENDRWMRNLRNREKKGMAQIYETHIDIDNDGDVDRVYMYDYGKCDPQEESHYSMPGGRNLFVWDDENNCLHRGLNQYLKFKRFDMFIYKGKVYLDYFGAHSNFQGGRLDVYKSGDGIIGSVVLCRFNYID